MTEREWFEAWAKRKGFNVNRMPLPDQRLYSDCVTENLWAGWQARAGELPREPTEAMLIAARDWSAKVYGKPIGNGAATGCWQVMLDAALIAQSNEIGGIVK